MTITISLTGTFSSGKTTLAKNLARTDHRINLLNELSAEAKGKIPEFDWSTESGRGFLFWAQAMREVDILHAARPEDSIVLLDGSLIDAVAYSRVYKITPPEIWRKYVRNYNLVMLCDSSIPLIEDGIRIPDQAHRDAIHEEILKVLKEANLEKVDIKGTVLERVRAASSEFDRRLKYR